MTKSAKSARHFITNISLITNGKLLHWLVKFKMFCLPYIDKYLSSSFVTLIFHDFSRTLSSLTYSTWNGGVLLAWPDLSTAEDWGDVGQSEHKKAEQSALIGRCCWSNWEKQLFEKLSQVRPNYIYITKIQFLLDKIANLRQFCRKKYIGNWEAHFCSLNRGYHFWQLLNQKTFFLI